MNDLRAGVIGVGFVGAQHAEAIRRLGSVDVTVIAASTADRAADAAARLAVAHAAPDWQAIVADPDVDVVHVCVPNDLHHPVVSAALRAGKHVICEKPLARTAEEAAELVELATASDAVTVLCHNYRYFPMVAELRSRLRSGDLGALHNVRGSYLQDWLLSQTDTNWRIDPDRGGASRAIADIGSHWIDLAEVVTGRRVERVTAQIGTVHKHRPDYVDRFTFTPAPSQDGLGGWLEVDTEDQAAMLLRFQDGLQGSLAVSQVAAGHKNGLDLAVDGADGSAQWRQERPDQLWIGRRGRSTELVPRDPQLLSPAASALARLPAGHVEGWSDALRNLVAAAYGAIRGDPPAPGGMPLPTFEDGLRHMLFTAAALRSAREQRWVSIEEVQPQGRETRVEA